MDRMIREMVGPAEARNGLSQAERRPPPTFSSCSSALHPVHPVGTGKRSRSIPNLYFCGIAGTQGNLSLDGLEIRPYEDLVPAEETVGTAGIAVQPYG